jgi:LysR family transcriptional regulator, flagellar master operon regulator
MQIELLDTFLDLIETRSFNRTAERLGITQSTVSGRVKALETALGAVLFIRSRAGTDLSTEGLKFETHARTLRHAWTEARRAVLNPTAAALSLRVGVQNDLAGVQIGALVAEFRRALPQTAFYIEPDYSAQMCADLVTGAQDFAVMFSPRPHPDLHFASAGEVIYRMVSTEATSRAELHADRYIFANFSPAFEAAHRQLLPALTGAPLSVGQSSAVSALLREIGGAGYVLAETAAGLLAEGMVLVGDAPAIAQPVYAAMHLRQRISPLHRRLTQIVTRSLRDRPDPPLLPRR